jgi:MoxR-like ATPase
MADSFPEIIKGLRAETQKAVVGYDEMLTHVLVAIFAGGHVLLEGVPGLGKTYLVRVLSQVIGLDPGRVQCTPDLMPADILGTHIVGEDENGRRVLRFEQGPVFRNLLLVDEINRATPKTQAALLEVMQETQVTIDGETLPLPPPFMTLATQNPIEQEGTYALPEAQLDRFLMKVLVDYPEQADEERIVAAVTAGQGSGMLDTGEVRQLCGVEEVIRLQAVAAAVVCKADVVEYAVRIVRATRAWQGLSLGAGTRGAISLVRVARAFALLDGRGYAVPDDVKRAAIPVLRHRVSLSPELQISGQDVDGVLAALLRAIPAPR